MSDIKGFIETLNEMYETIEEQKKQIEKLTLADKVLNDRIKILEKALNKPT